MGVQGLTAFLQKKVPHVFKEIPNRIHGLHGKTIVVDGTLVTQRLHFSAIPHPYRHVLGWYRLARQLQAQSVGVICVFDGPQRALAKAREHARRQANRDLTMARGQLEDSRVARLERISVLLRQAQVLADEDAPPAPRRFYRRFLAPTWRRPRTTTPQIQRDWVEHNRSVSKASTGDTEPTGSLKTSKLELDWTLQDVGLRQKEIDSLVSDLDMKQHLQEATPQSPAEFGQPEVQRELAALREDFERSIPKFRLPLQVIEKQVKANLAGDEVAIGSEDVLGEEPSDFNEHAMSKFQYDLMVEEGILWETLDSPDALDTAHALHVRSAAISASYEKRNDPPSERTYIESKQMLEALGVPCLSSDGPFEGEAFASALVHAGLADCVATEDTDVIVYEAPMLRGLTKQYSPLTLVSGKEVRESLAFTRAQFVDLMLLMGTDFSTRIKNVGPMRAFNFMQKYGSIEAVLDAGAAKAYKTDLSAEEQSAYLAEVQLGRDVFNNMPSVVQDEVNKALKVQKDEAVVKKLLRAFDLERAAYQPELRQWLRDAGEETPGLGVNFWAIRRDVGGLGDDGRRTMGVDMFDDAPLPAQRLQVQQ